MRAILASGLLLLALTPSAAAFPPDCDPSVPCAVETARELLECTCPSLTETIKELAAETLVFIDDTVRDVEHCVVGSCAVVEPTLEALCDRIGCAADP